MTARTTAIALATFLAAASQATYYSNTYAFSFNEGSPAYTVSRFYILESREASDYSFNYGFRLPSATISSPFGGQISDYANTLTAPATTALIIAETNELPGDAPGQKHILLGISSDAASYAQNIAWGTLFRNTLEEDVISGLDNYVDPNPTTASNALQTLVDFAQGDAKTGILDNLAQPHSAWFTPGTNFTLMTWSDGKIVGSGVSTQQATPEPATLTVFGLGALAVLRRRRTIRA